jgi:type IV pilus assembly protein PilW
VTTLAQRGMTLVELLVAMAISLVVALAAMFALLTSRSGYSNVDAASQLRDNTRLTNELLQRLIVQAGFKDPRYAATARPKDPSQPPSASEPAIFGFNNATPSLSDPGHVSAGAAPGNSDVLVVRYQAPETATDSGLVDRSIINCLGQPAPNGQLPLTSDTLLTSVVYVDEYKGEPSLMCVTVDTLGTISTPRPIVKGIESFQVLYGTDGVTPGTAPTEAADSVIDRMLRADQLTVPGDAAATNQNWRRVRSVRVGLVARAAPGSAVAQAAEKFLPLGIQYGVAADPGSVVDSNSDGRLRQVSTTTVHLRNEQDL